MAIKFYRKLSPSTKVVLSNNSVVEFKTLDNVVGFFSTEDSFIQGEFVRFEQEQRYGIDEINYSDFHAQYLVKKNRSQPGQRYWREEINPGLSGLQQVRQLQDLDPVVVAREKSDIAGAGVIAADHSDVPKTAPSTPQEFNPPVGRRLKT